MDENKQHAQASREDHTNRTNPQKKFCVLLGNGSAANLEKAFAVLNDEFNGTHYADDMPDGYDDPPFMK